MIYRQRFGTCRNPSPTEMCVFLYNYGLIVKFDCYCGHGTPCPYDCNTNVTYIAVWDGIPDVPKRHLYINLKFGLQFSPKKPTFPLDLPVAASQLNYSLCKKYKSKSKKVLTKQILRTIILTIKINL